MNSITLSNNSRNDAPLSPTDASDTLPLSDLQRSPSDKEGLLSLFKKVATLPAHLEQKSVDELTSDEVVEILQANNAPDLLIVSAKDPNLTFADKVFLLAEINSAFQLPIVTDEMVATHKGKVAVFCSGTNQFLGNSIGVSQSRIELSNKLSALGLTSGKHYFAHVID